MKTIDWLWVLVVIVPVLFFIVIPIVMFWDFIVFMYSIFTETIRGI